MCSIFAISLYFLDERHHAKLTMLFAFLFLVYSVIWILSTKISLENLILLIISILYIVIRILTYIFPKIKVLGRNIDLKIKK